MQSRESTPAAHADPPSVCTPAVRWAPSPSPAHAPLRCHCGASGGSPSLTVPLVGRLLEVEDTAAAAVAATAQQFCHVSGGPPPRGRRNCSSTSSRSSRDLANMKAVQHDGLGFTNRQQKQGHGLRSKLHHVCCLSTYFSYELHHATSCATLAGKHMLRNSVPMLLVVAVVSPCT